MSELLDDSGRGVTTGELQIALEEMLSRHFDRPCGITRLERRPCAYRSSWAMEELDVCLDDGTCLPLMFKDLSHEAQLEAARYGKPEILYDPLREMETYHFVLAPSRLGTARWYGSVVAAGRYWLFLERVPGVELCQVGNFATWQGVARWLAILHSRLAPEAERLSPLAHLLLYNDDFYRLWVKRVQSFADASGPARARDARRRLDPLFRGYDRVVERLLELPVTIIHGEFYAPNILVHATATELRVCPVDWELAALGPGLIDLAALTAGTWSEEERATLALAYHAELVASQGAREPPEAFLATLDYCRLHLAVQWLGWSARWSPPPAHAQDWLGLAARLAEKLGF
jgi:hypothetical protein